MKVAVSFPEELLHSLRIDKKTFQREVLLYTLGKLYEKGRISAGLAAGILGCDRWEFYQLLSEHGFYVIDYPEDELEEEVKEI
ncbi:UPF0175 family protein [Desulfothermus sp.]